MKRKYKIKRSYRHDQNYGDTVRTARKRHLEYKQNISLIKFYLNPHSPD